MIAVYYDVENLLEYENYRLAILKVKEVVANSESIQFAYAEWARFDNASRELFIANGIGMKQVVNGVGYYSNVKNISDITIAVDAIEILFKNTKIDHFILVSGDGGFVPLALKLREYGKKVSIVALSKNISKHIINYVNDYFIIDEEGLKTIVQKNIESTIKDINLDKEIYETIWSIMTQSRSPSATTRNIFKNPAIKSFIKEYKHSYNLLEKIYLAVNSKKPNSQQSLEKFIASLKKKINASLASISTVEVQSNEDIKYDKGEIKLDNQEVDMRPQQEYEHYQRTIWAIMCNSKSGQEAVDNIFKSKEIESHIEEYGLSKIYLIKTYFKTCYGNPNQQELSKDFNKSLKQKIKLSYSEQGGIIFPKGQIIAKPKQEAESLSDEAIRDICKKNGLFFSVSEISKELFLEIVMNKKIYEPLKQGEMTDLLVQNTKRSRIYADTVTKVVSFLDSRKRQILSPSNHQSLLSGAIALYINDVSGAKAHVNKKHIAGMLKWRDNE